MVREILLLGDPRLERVCRPVERGDLGRIHALRDDLRDTLLAYRREHGAGRGIAAPQIGEPMRAVYLHWPEPRLLLNPELDEASAETLELWDDCMSFPELMVRVRRHRSCRVRYREPDWTPRVWRVEDDLAELVQHEVDHLDGVLALARAVGPGAIALRRQLEKAGGLPRRIAG